MSSDDHSGYPVDDDLIDDAAPACTALVPVAEPAQWSRIRPLPRPDAIFLTQLIATSEIAPQTTSLRRATAFDANAAYTANQHRFAGAGLGPRQVA